MLMWAGYPFYSHVLGIGVVEAYHSHPECLIAQSIAKRYRLPGTGPGWPHCRFCLMHYDTRRLAVRAALLLDQSLKRPADTELAVGAHTG